MFVQPPKAQFARNRSGSPYRNLLTTLSDPDGLGHNTLERLTSL